MHEARPMPGVRLKSLRVSIALLVGGAMVFLLAILLAVSTLVISYSFGSLQDRLTADRIQRVAQGISHLADSKIRVLRDNAEWDEAYGFIGGSDPDFLVRNFAPDVNSSGQDVILVFDARKQLVGSVVPENEDEPYAPPEGLDVSALAESRLFDAGAAFGLVAAGEDLLLLAACPVLPSDRSGASNGWLVFGTYFTEESAEDLVFMSGAESVAVRPDGESSPPEPFEPLALEVPFLGKLAAAFAPARSAGDASVSSAARLSVPALMGGRNIVFEIGVALAVYEHALETRNWIAAISFLCATASVFLGLIAVETHVIKPLASLDRQMSAMAAKDGAVEPLKVPREDEIGRLAGSANRLLTRMQAAQRESKEQHKLIDSILDSAAEGIIAYVTVRNSEGAIEDFRIVVCNRTAERICRVQEGEMIGKTMLSMFPRVQGSEIFDVLVRTVTERRARTWEGFYEGDRFTGWVRISCAPWNDGIVVTFEDISERKHRERELSETYAELERFNAAMIGREERIIEMKREVNRLRGQLGLELAYDEPEERA